MDGLRNQRPPGRRVLALAPALHPEVEGVELAELREAVDALSFKAPLLRPSCAPLAPLLRPSCAPLAPLSRPSRAPLIRSAQARMFTRVACTRAAPATAAARSDGCGGGSSWTRWTLCATWTGRSAQSHSRSWRRSVHSMPRSRGARRQRAPHAPRASSCGRSRRRADWRWQRRRAPSPIFFPVEIRQPAVRETCSVSTEGGARPIQLVRKEGRDVSS